MELALTGDFLTAERAYALGLVNRLTSAGGALREARRLAAAIAANGPLAVGITKQVLVESRDWPADVAFERQRGMTAPVFASRDAQEGARAFAEKRAPTWTGE
jgi:enoyl-CoA hydratase